MATPNRLAPRLVPTRCRVSRGMLAALVAGALQALAPPPEALAAEPAAETLFYAERDAIPTAYRWNMADIFAGPEEFESAIAEVEAMLPRLAAVQGTVGESPARLAAALDLAFSVQRLTSEVYTYANQTLHLDTRDAAGNELAGRAAALLAKVGETSAFLAPEIAQIPPETLARFLEDPAVAAYGHYLDDLARSREHIRSAEVEEVLAGAAQLASAPQRAASSLENADIAWPTVTGEDGEPLRVVPGQYTAVVSSEDRDVRREGALALFRTYDQHANTFAATLGGSIHEAAWRARVRGYGSSLEMVLDSSNVPRAVVDTLVSTVRDNLHQVHSYAALRKRLLGLDDLHVYDLYVDLLPGTSRRYTFDEGWALAMSFWRETFGAEYAAVAERALAERWIDVYTNEGKRPGAYSWGTFESHPYLLLNWTGDLEAVSTLVHEMGHSIHTYLASENQPFHYADYSLFVAEVASVASESLFLDWMLARSTDPAERQQVLNQAMDSITGTFLRQIFFHEFEAMAHAMAESGEPLTKESLGTRYVQLWQEYYGPELVVDAPYSAEWARISHFYRSFYVWVYATSYAAGEAIAQRFRGGDATAVQDYLAMLRLGGSVYPMEAVARAGVDMTDPQVIRAVMDRYGRLQAQLERELAPAPARVGGRAAAAPGGE